MNPFVEKIYDNENDLWGYPQEYKNIKFYPVKLNDVKTRKLFYRLFSYPKNYIPDAQILRMSYLKYLLYVVQMSVNPEGNELQTELIDFLKNVTKIEDIKLLWGINDQLTGVESIYIKILIGDVEFSESEFQNIREIVLEQNGLNIDYIEDFNPDLEEKLMQANKTTANVTLEEEIFAFCALMGKTIHEVGEYTLYQFKRHFERLILLQQFELYTPLEASGQIKTKDGYEIKHYLTHIENTKRYDSILISKDSYVGSETYKGVFS